MARTRKPAAPAAPARKGSICGINNRKCPKAAVPMTKGTNKIWFDSVEGLKAFTALDGAAREALLAAASEKFGVAL